MSARPLARIEPAPCPLCGSLALPAFAVGDRNRGIASESAPFPYRRCTSCESYFLLPVPADLDRHYPPSYHSWPNARELDRIAQTEIPKLDLLRAAVTSGRLLEIGPGAGLFTRAAVLTGFDVTVIEMDARCCEYIESVVGARAVHSDRPDLAVAELPPFDAIAMWHVIEHLSDPWTVLEASARSLTPGGAVIIGTPNPQALQFRLLGRYWAHVDAPRHLFLIPAATLGGRAAELGLRHAMTTTADPAGRHWNRFGWEYALRRCPARRPTTPVTQAASLALTLALRPWETRGLNGATYTSLFVRDATAE